MPELTDRVTLGGVELPNRLALAPLAGIGSWFVRLQARRYGAGLVVSEMSRASRSTTRNEKTCRELLRIDPRERDGGRFRSSCSGPIRRSCARLPRPPRQPAPT